MLVEQALRAGFRGIDTANQRRHYFEAGVGEGLAAAYGAGIATRTDLFLQTKFTYRSGQDHRLPYDASEPLSQQVAQSLASSLEHLGTDYVESYVLHGPASNYGWTAADGEVWEAMKNERDAGRARMLGVSNISLRHLQQMIEVHGEAPAFVQNRCYARLGWDRDIRQFCVQHGIVYQGFSLLTANVDVSITRCSAESRPGLMPLLRKLSLPLLRAVRILPLTGTSNPEHMRQDLSGIELKLSADEISAIESLAC